MKKILLSVLGGVIALVLSSCNDRVVTSLGKCDKEEFYTCGVFQDFTDYGKYHYSEADPENNKYLVKIGETDVDRINEYLSSFEGTVGSIKQDEPEQELAANYDFDRALIDTEDYFYILDKSEEGELSKFSNYNVYFFDSQTKVLYYFHDNT